jgi:hypothetical protein
MDAIDEEHDYYPEFDSAHFSIAIDESIDTIFSYEPIVYIIHDRCSCCDVGEKTFYTIRSNRPITYRSLFRQLMNQGLRPRCGHRFVEGVDIVSFQTYTLAFGS